MRNVAVFTQRLIDLKGSIDVALDQHVRQLKRSTAHNYTPYSAVAVDAFGSIVARGGKRVRGALAIVGYEMCGGKDETMILQAACALELTHAYILILDDIMDKSVMRRGGKSAHMLLADYHRQHGLSGDSYHFGEAIAINAALIGNHYAQSLIAQLSVNDDIRTQAMYLLNEALVVTGHGQINDIFNEALDHVDDRAVDNVLEWKTAHYTILNPLQFGMALAGASTDTLESIREYAMHAGRAFQITDDILGTFGTEQEAGKSPMDDIREGKRTVLSLRAIEHASNGNKNFLIQMLGNEKLTQAEFARCKEIIIATGALDEAMNLAKQHVHAAQAELQTLENLQEEQINFLHGLVSYLLERRV